MHGRTHTHTHTPGVVVLKLSDADPPGVASATAVTEQVYVLSGMRFSTTNIVSVPLVCPVGVGLGPMQLTT